MENMRVLSGEMEKLESRTVYLDTNSLIALSGLPETDFRSLKTRLGENSIRLNFSHIQVDEMQNKEFMNYQEKINEATKKLSENGIVVDIKPTKGTVQGLWRNRFTENFTHESVKIYDEIREEIKKCMGIKAEQMNIARDALIAISSLNHDYFITCDWCLWKSWVKIVENNVANKNTIEKIFQIPKIIHVKAKPQAVMKGILNLM